MTVANIMNMVMMEMMMTMTMMHCGDDDCEYGDDNGDDDGDE